MDLVFSFQVFRSVLSRTSLFPVCNITVMRKQSGTHKVHVSPEISVFLL